jgi:hypothetical protein
MRRPATIAILALAAAGVAAQETPRSGRLYDELAAMDRELFAAAFVDCDPVKFRSLFTEAAEFYHDLDGAKTGEQVTELRGCPRDRGVSRILVEGSLEVWPVKDYGAIQTGRHMFVTAGQQEAGIAKFVHLWRHSDGQPSPAAQP